MQREHLEQLRVADLLGEAAHVFEVEDVAAHGVGHFQMQPDELEDGLALFGVEVEAGEESCRPARRSAPVCSPVRRRLAGVVQQQGEQEQVEAVDFRQQLRQALLVLVRRLAEAVHVVDGEEGVLVDGVAVVAVADDQGVDAVELGDQHLENAEGVHGAQGVRGVRARAGLRAARSRGTALRGCGWRGRAARR